MHNEENVAKEDLYNRRKVIMVIEDSRMKISQLIREVTYLWDTMSPQLKTRIRNEELEFYHRMEDLISTSTKEAEEL